MIRLEVCIDSAVSAVHAERGGAHRVELCGNLLEGGTTPSTGCIEVVREYTSVGLHVMIRPRGGDFLYDAYEFAEMKRDVREAKKRTADGVVIGLLTPTGEIDRRKTEELIELARPLNVTFHRAFDMTHDPLRALDDLMELGIDRILTSGQRASAIEGAALIAELVQRSDGQLCIMPGGGIHEANIAEVVAQTGVQECHVSGRKRVESAMEFRNSGVSMGKVAREYERQVVSTQRIQDMVAAANLKQ